MRRHLPGLTTMEYELAVEVGRGYPGIKVERVEYWTWVEGEPDQVVTFFEDYQKQRDELLQRLR